jgi:hypothetical protein
VTEIQVFVAPEEAQTLERSTSVMVDAAESWVIQSEADVEDASKYLKVIADSKKTIEERRQFLVRPLNNHVSSINEMFKRFLAPALEADRILRGKISTFRTEQQKARLEEQRRVNEAAAALQRKLSDEAAAEGVEAPKVMAPTVLPPPATIGNASMRKVWKFDVLDDELVPRDYLVVDESLIRKAMAAGVREIPGVRIYQDEQVTIR